MDVANILTKGIGYATIGLVAYDAHAIAKLEASSFQKNHKSEMIHNSLVQTMHQEKPSMVESNIKKRVHIFKMDENISEFFTGIVGYAKGFSKMLVSDVIPLGLATGAVVAPKGWWSRSFGIGLAVYGGIYFLHNILGIAKPHKK